MISTYPKVQAVTGPDPSAETVFDFNRIDDLISCTVAHADWSIGVPQLEGDVDAIHPMYTERVLSYTLQVEGSEGQALNAQALLARWLLAGPGWIRFQLSPLTEPVTFATYRARPGDLSFAHVVVDQRAPGRRSLWEIGVEVPAEPFAYGAKVTLDPIVLSNDPAAATNPCRVVIPEVRGDAPAPFRFDVSAAACGGGSRWMMALHAGTTQRTPVLVDIGTGDGLTAGTDTDAGTAGAQYVGGSARVVDFGTVSTMETRLTGLSQPPVTTGRWRVLLRVNRLGGMGDHVFRFLQTAATTLVTGATVASARGDTSTAHAYWVDLGEFTFPAFGPPPGEPGTFAGSGGWELQVGVPSGTHGYIGLDALLFVPVEVEDTIAAQALFTNLVDGLPYQGVWDGDLERFWAYAGGLQMAASRPEIAGRFPELVPGVSNVLTILRQVNGPTPPQGGDASDAITAAGTLTLSYYPRHLYIGQG